MSKQIRGGRSDHCERGEQSRGDTAAINITRSESERDRVNGTDRVRVRDLARVRGQIDEIIR